ncbi:MAG: TonB-dependent receptor [Pseudomonadota bacterium]
MAGRLIIYLGLGLVLVGNLISSPGASAQETPLQGIVISASKIDRSYLETPTSVGVATSDDIEDYGLTSVTDTFNRMGNVRFFSRFGGNTSLQIRGLNADGISEISNSVPLVSVLIDGATQNREGTRRGFRSTWDLKKVEVLRGPQSGLYGRAALAGVVLIESNDPTYSWEAALRGNVGTFDREGGSFMLSGPILDNQLAFRISGDVRKETKNITYTDPGNEPLEEDEFRNFRGKILFEPQAVSGLRALLTFNHAFDKTGDTTVSGPDYFDRKLVEDATSAEFREATINNYVANISYAFSDAFKLRSISSIISTTLDISSAPSQSIFFRDDTREGDDFTQEVRLEIDDKTRSGVSGVLGFFYGDFDEATDSVITFDASAFGAGVLPIQVGEFGNATETAALYADLRYNVYGPWSLLGGLRYQRDKVRNRADISGLNIDNFDGTFGSIIPFVSQYDRTEEFSVVLPKVGVAYEIDKTQTLSATARKGYRQGFSESIIATSTINNVDPEFAWTYELAYRLESLNKRTSFGINVFYNDYEDQQISIITNPPLPFVNTFNIGSSYSYGAELEGKYDFANGLKIFGSLGLVKTEIRELENDNLCADNGGDCSGNEFPEAPNVTLSFGGIYRHDSGLFVSADVNYTGAYYSTGDLNNSSELEVENFTIVNTKFGFQNANFYAAAYVKNLFDEEYVTGIRPSLSSPAASVGDSRTIGVEFKTSF